MIGDEENFGDANKEVIIILIFVDLKAVHDLLRNLIQLLQESIYFEDCQICPLHYRNEKTKEGELNWHVDI